MQDSFWNERYGGEVFAYGTEPNLYLKKFIDTHDPGRILLPGEGEGRNAVYATGKGWEVYAMDQSETGKDKALKLAESKGVTIHYTVADISKAHFDKKFYDVIAWIFVHFPPGDRERLHLESIACLRPGGFILMEAFSKNQLGKKSGGPKEENLLYNKKILGSDFRSLEILELYETNVILDEGPFHQGEAAVVRLIGKKKE